MAIVSVEHPFIIKNIDKGIGTLGGNGSMSKLVRPDSKDGIIGLYIRPEDPMCKPVMSNNVTTRNVVLQITVPKRTGRRRKKGSAGPFMDYAETDRQVLTGITNGDNQTSARSTRHSNANYLLQGLRDNEGSYKIKPVGVIEQTHRFRSKSATDPSRAVDKARGRTILMMVGMSDFVYSTANSPFMKKIRENILPFQYNKLKQFSLDRSKGVKVNTDLIPPPTFSHISIPFNYSYRQNPAVKQTVDDSGRRVTINTQSAAKVLTHLVAYDVEIVPSKAPTDVASFDTLDSTLQRVITQLHGLLEERPIWTRRAMLNKMSNKEYIYTLKHAFQYVGYMFRSGPWRDAVVKFGVDPRTDPKYRVYQTMMFQIYTREPDAAGPKRWEDERTRYAKSMRGKEHNKHSHLFDGKRADLDGKVWQVCDITDPLLKSLLDTKFLREECDIRSDGWYHNGTWAKAKTIMKAKLTKILEGETPVDMDYAKLLQIPDIIDASTRKQAVLKGRGTPQEVQWASDIRTTASAPARRKPLGSDLAVGGRADLRRQEMEVVTGSARTDAQSAEVQSRVAEAMLEFGRNEHDLDQDGLNEDADLGTMEGIYADEDDEAKEDDDDLDE
ncbi:MAG: tau 95 subunit of transcription factor TFIIIC [Pleopsidium flavum]|nr:MAG: tau 95 subunit of transcription factor TFIIIC [Pleopsidium flavum]